MKLALVQFNPTIGDLEANALAMARFAREAHGQGADLAVFPELALCGYPPKDLVLQHGFVDACTRHAAALARDVPKGLTIVFGCPLPAQDPRDPGFSRLQPRGICNSLLVYRDGMHIDYYDKRLLPTYDVFDEDRYFTPGDRAVILDIGGVRVGLSICEDLWRGEDVGFSSRYESKPDPVEELVLRGAELIINPSASPFVLGKGQRHRDLLRRHAMRRRVYVAAVNQVGGNDELVFDGHAAIYSPTGEMVAAGPGFDEGIVYTEFSPLDSRGEDPGAPSLHHTVASTPTADPLTTTPDEEHLYRALVLGVRDYCRKTGFSNVVLGLSGGIDSAVTAVIAAAALGPESVLAVGLPSKFSSEGSIADARSLAQNLGVRFVLVPIQDGVDALQSAIDPVFNAYQRTEFSVAEENLQSRVRGTLLMALSNKLNHLLLTTGNKSELAVGYCTLYGDMNGGLAVLSDISKQWVYRLSRWVNEHPDRLIFPAGCARRIPARSPIPGASITKPPSAELRPNQTDQDSLPPYDVLDRIIERYVEQRQSPGEIIAQTGIDPGIVARCVRMIDLAEYKRKQTAVGLKVTGVAFGTGRRMPIAQRYRPAP